MIENKPSAKVKIHCCRLNSEIADNNIDTYSSDTDLCIDKKFEESNKYIEDEEEASLDLVNLRNSDPDNIKIYFRSKKKISAKVIYDDDDMKLPFSNITVSGYIPLFQRNIERLLNFGETLVDTFSLPTEEEIAIRRPFHHYDKDTSFDSRQAAFCEINKKHQIFIDNYDNLYIYRLDAQKLKERYKRSVSFAAVDIDDTASNESYSEANIDDTASNESYSEANIDDTASNESYSEANIDILMTPHQMNLILKPILMTPHQMNLILKPILMTPHQMNLILKPILIPAKQENMNTKSITTEMQQLIVWHLCYGEITKIYCLHN